MTPTNGGGPAQRAATEHKQLLPLPIVHRAAVSVNGVHGRGAS